MPTLAPDSAYRNGPLLKVNARYDAFLAAGFPVTLEGNAETLQCRNELDRTNWLTLIGICQEAITAEFGDYPIPEPGLRCTSNTNYLPTFAETLELLKALRAWAAAAQGNWWRLKDAVRDAPTRQALFAIDLDEGWP